ncbi:Serine/threonine-protein kinase StkP [Enhygromyxa salina]|uniref:Serine/threonine-protein kinase StkP n=1 Tax=Enhygromyxa salina TaxID=215803 RepID=A0A2S9XZ08_9BACT|nr:serine/threonine-protein kinase [Enhygromyxa salina]PRP98097.1 Serine/threonine-protein kinase StkP [Enhygromyxa salina]
MAEKPEDLEEFGDTELQIGSLSELTVTGRGVPIGGRAGPGPSARPRSIATPSRIGRYTVDRELGAGGMGVVFLARDPDLDRRVAVKLLGPGSSAGRNLGRASARMRREARVMARLEHPNVVRVYEVGNADGHLFVAMEYVDGVTLDAWLAEAPRSWAEIAAVFLQAGEGLLAAHEVGIVHRDFKPNNVMVEADTGASQLVGVRTRVLDFGLAGLSDAPELDDEDLDGAQAERAAEDAARLTMTGAMMGTPAYMPPEQFAGTPADHRADQFSFCVALYEALYGARPFPGDTLEALRQSVLAGDHRQPPMASGVPPWLRALVLRGLAAEPDQRWPSMRELLVELANNLDVAVSDELGRSAGRNVRTWLLGAMAVLVVSSASVVFMLFADQRDAIVHWFAGAITLAIVIVMFAFRRTFASSRYNRRMAALLIATALGSFANLATSTSEALPLVVTDRYNLMLLAALSLVGSASLEPRLVLVSGACALAWALAFWWPIAAGAGFVLGLALTAGLLLLGSTTGRQHGATISMSMRGSSSRGADR